MSERQHQQQDEFILFYNKLPINWKTDLDYRELWTASAHLVDDNTQNKLQQVFDIVLDDAFKNQKESMDVFYTLAREASNLYRLLMNCEIKLPIDKKNKNVAFKKQYGDGWYAVCLYNYLNECNTYKNCVSKWKKNYNNTTDEDDDDVDEDDDDIDEISNGDNANDSDGYDEYDDSGNDVDISFNSLLTHRVDIRSMSPMALDYFKEMFDQLRGSGLKIDFRQFLYYCKQVRQLLFFSFIYN